MRKGELFLRKHSSTILTIVGSVGVVVTSVLTAKATIKAVKLVKKERYRRQEYKTIFADNERFETVVMPDLTPLEIVKVAWKPYIPAGQVLEIPAQTVVKGDGKYLSIAAASVLAKTYRDEYMLRLHEQYPHYHWDTNMGYPTKAHYEAIRQYGITPVHRKSFKLEK